MDPARAVWHCARNWLALGLWLPLTPEDNPARLHRGAGRRYVAPLHLKELPAVFVRVPRLRTSADSMLRTGVNKLDEAPHQISHVKHPSEKTNQLPRNQPGIAGQHCARHGALSWMAPSFPSPSAAHAAIRQPSLSAPQGAPSFSRRVCWSEVMAGNTTSPFPCHAARDNRS